jgi:hypothetical protein
MLYAQNKTPWIRYLRVQGLVFIALLSAGSGQAQTTLQSGPDQVSMVELYTSQGCSSCPPADRWLSKLKRHPDLWKQVIPVAFHVDYWDYIGWQDPLAQPEFGQRQRRYAKEGGVRTVYTPGMMLNGKDWRGWAKGNFPRTKQPDAGMLTVEFKEQQLLVDYQPTNRTSRKLLVYIALLGFDLKSNVTAGENRGRELTSDFIVLDLIQKPLQRGETNYTASVPEILPDQDFPRFAIAAWVAESSKQAPLQAVGGWLE